jgi:hypothetical protein
MKYTGTLIALLGATCLGAMATAVPAQAASKPCCYNNGDYFQSSPSTCRNYGGRVVQQEYCQAGYYGDDRGGYYDRGYDRGDGDTSFSIQFGNVVFAYSDGYYDRSRRWHSWRNDRERNWYRQHRRSSYYETTRDRDRHRGRRDWRDGRRNDWRD